MSKIVIIETCDQCPNFVHPEMDSCYETNERCRILNRYIEVTYGTEDDVHNIPKDCPMPDYEKEESK